MQFVSVAFFYFLPVFLKLCVCLCVRVRACVRFDPSLAVEQVNWEVCPQCPHFKLTFALGSAAKVPPPSSGCSLDSVRLIPVKQFLGAGRPTSRFPAQFCARTFGPFVLKSQWSAIWLWFPSDSLLLACRIWTQCLYIATLLAAGRSTPRGAEVWWTRRLLAASFFECTSCKILGSVNSNFVIEETWMLQLRPYSLHQLSVVLFEISRTKCVSLGLCLACCAENMHMKYTIRDHCCLALIVWSMMLLPWSFWSYVIHYYPLFFFLLQALLRSYTTTPMWLIYKWALHIQKQSIYAVICRDLSPA